MKFKDLDIEIQSKFVKDVIFELYPFTFNDFEDLENKLDFKVISKNQNIDWDLNLLKKYQENWDWKEIEDNPIICREVNLGLIFPGLVKMTKAKCDCYKELPYCEKDKYCNSNYDRSKMRRKQLNILNADLYGYIKFLLEENFIENTVMSNILLYDMLINYAGDYEITKEDNSESLSDSYEDLPF